MCKKVRDRKGNAERHESGVKKTLCACSSFGLSEMHPENSTSKQSRPGHPVPPVSSRAAGHVHAGLIAGLFVLVASTGAWASTSPCEVGSGAAAAKNAASLDALKWAPFKRPETGWDMYEPLIAQEIGTACPAGSPGFAASLAGWQKKHALPGTGVLDPGTFAQMYQVWEQRRPFVTESQKGCPPAPQASDLAEAAPGESYGGKHIFLRPQALAAYRMMVAAARNKQPALDSDPKLFTIFSGYRSPDEDAARCARENNCQGVIRATCSAHRTGLAMDLYLGAAPGFAPDSSADANRLYLSRSIGYRWLVRNASRFGFANYAFEPWHWEWTGKTGG
ncbi:MAG TPA: D-alanyl-D-alanine carboxypeptidase family protein [Rhizomicrobium sp.]